MSFILLLSIVFILSGGSITTKYGITTDKTINPNETDLKKKSFNLLFHCRRKLLKAATQSQTGKITFCLFVVFFMHCFTYHSLILQFPSDLVVLWPQLLPHLVALVSTFLLKHSLWEWRTGRNCKAAVTLPTCPWRKHWVWCCSNGDGWQTKLPVYRTFFFQRVAGHSKNAHVYFSSIHLWRTKLMNKR